MKNSLGTLAAVAALAAATTTTVSARVEYATHLFDVIIDSSNPSIDINNDGIADYEVLNGNRLMGEYFHSSQLQNKVAVNSSNLQTFAFGDTIDANSTYSNYGYISMGAPGIIGLSFYINENLHYAWLQLGLDEGDLIILDGAWQTIANTPLEIIPVPEPTTMAAGIALLVGAAALLRRRSKRNAC